MVDLIRKMVPRSLRSPFWPRPFARATFNADGMATTHDASFMRDPKFSDAYAAGVNTNHGFGSDLHIEWRVYTCCWAAARAVDARADLVECGVNTGINALSVAKYVGLERHNAVRMFLLDTFCGIPEDSLLEGERKHAIGVLNRIYRDCYDDVVSSFRPYENVRVVRGTIPGTLEQVDSDRIGYLSVDLNAASPEVSVLETLWERIVPAGVVVLDDYGWLDHAAQKDAHDAFARSKGVQILALPTGQGLLVKP